MEDALSQHSELYEAVGELRGIVSGIDDKVDQILGRLDKQNGRIGKLEEIKDKAIGAGLGITAGSAGVGGVVGAIIQRIFH